MIGISAQISLYPLEQADIAGSIEGVISVLRERELAHEMGAMSTLTWGDEEAVFGALREAFLQAAERGPAVMVITVSNACPVRTSAADEEPHV
jgi:uncharacterized protein YqgV (UPF0045/DUF77 family)